MKWSYETRGTYVHPALITSIANWISPSFAVNVSLWVEEWKKYTKHNNIKYWTTFSKCKPLLNYDREKGLKIN
jgi:hypothetical protein